MGTLDPNRFGFSQVHHAFICVLSESLRVKMNGNRLGKIELLERLCLLSSCANILKYRCNSRVKLVGATNAYRLKVRTFSGEPNWHLAEGILEASNLLGENLNNFS